MILESSLMWFWKLNSFVWWSLHFSVTAALNYSRLLFSGRDWFAVTSGPPAAAVSRKTILSYICKTIWLLTHRNLLCDLTAIVERYACRQRAHFPTRLESPEGGVSLWSQHTQVNYMVLMFGVTAWKSTEMTGFSRMTDAKHELWTLNQYEHCNECTGSLLYIRTKFIFRTLDTCTLLWATLISRDYTSIYIYIYIYIYTSIYIYIYIYKLITICFLM